MRSDPAKRQRSWSIFLLAALFTAAGISHFVIPGKYEGVIPFWIPDHSFIVKLSGVFEIAGGIGLRVRQTRVAAAWGLIVLLVAVFPANVEMLRQAYTAADSSELWKLALWLRLPLQGALIWWIGWAARMRLLR